MKIPDTLAPGTPEVLVRVVACCLALGKIGFTMAHLRWANSQAAVDDVSQPTWWQPYDMFRGAVYMKPWAVGHLNYINGETLSGPRLALIEPESFYRGLADAVRSAGLTNDYVNLAMQAEAYTIPERAREYGYDLIATNLEVFYAHVAVARQQGKLITDSRRIKRLMKAA